MIDTTQLMKQVGRIKILTSRLIDERLSGDYHSMFKGQGIEFDEVRPYTPGDDVRSIDWNVTARAGHPHIKRFSEERELTVIFLVDVSGSHAFGSVRSKAELAAEITCLLALTAIRNQDKIGLILFSDRIVKYLPPRKGRTAVMRLVREVLAASEETRDRTDLTGALRFLPQIQKRKAVVFLVSDFQASSYESTLRVLSRRHDIIACDISDPAELTLPNLGLIELQDPETGELLLADTSSPALRAHFASTAASDRASLDLLLRRCSIDTLHLSTSTPPINEVRALFQRRARRR
jgi:uncharacterized protein (DUF58 family)